MNIYLGSLLLVGMLFASNRSVNMDGLRIESVRQDRPAFERIYHVRLNADVTMKIQIKWSADYLYKSGELDQTDGKWVLFDPESPADKILDRELLPSVEQRCRQILQMDNEFRNSEPSEFTDTRGRVWKLSH
jgi:hypothetical protein